jgi:pimeloyl-ACP methyl ester carboxylesterase
MSYQQRSDTPEQTPPPQKKLPVVGAVFHVRGRIAFHCRPEKPAGRPLPWVWYAPTLPAYPAEEERWMFERLLAAGIGIAGIDVGESYGSPDGRALFSALYDELTTRGGLSLKPVLLARSRGGLMHYNWAAENPSRVAGIAGIYPVCDPRRYPGLAKASGTYGMTEAQLAARLADHNPIERLAPLAKARVPLFHIHGDRDTVVPLEANSGELARRYRQLGGPMTLRVLEGRGHDLWPGWFQNQELLDFLIHRATAE